MATTTDAPGARATVRYLPTSPYKIRQVLDLVRGLPVDDAIRLLQLSPKGASDDILKLLDSAIANAEHNRAIPAEELYLAQAWCDEGPTRKSGQPRARGRYFRVRKRSSHMTIVLARFDADELAERRRREESTGRGASNSGRLTTRPLNLMMATRAKRAGSTSRRGSTQTPLRGRSSAG